MSEFWLISAPGDKTNLQAWERMNTVTSKSNLSSNSKFHIPDLKVGTLDALVGLSDELGKLDTFAESVIKKIVQYIGEVMEDSKDKVQENLLANGGRKDKMKCLKIDLISYLTRFEWDMAKYPIKQPLKNISEALAKQVTQIEADLKTRSAAYNNIKGNLQNLEKKTVGNLLTRTLADIVHKEDFVLNSEYLITLLVVVPKSSYVQWQKTYESLSDMVVPRSTKMIAEDAEGGLFTVTLFRKVMDDFKAKARENRFMVREFYFDEKELKCEKEELMKLASDKKQQYGPLLRWLKVNFSEAFVAWIHVKALRVFVESVLRYGLPVNFQAMLLQPNRKSVKRLRDVLNAVFKHLDEVAAASIMDPGMDIPGLQLSNQEYYPYVYFKIDLSLLDGS
ncbi:V-type proton ATPase subunit C 2 isoform X1 [Gallus gallus]|uniref:V-type proton ATPase subunit C 2 isoform X1 n=1 Tax=Gallus gallus TaxID=9031 RepID=UPI000D640521|nr:V-type proton ATPase subunit C 2 isoform X1 [Gallus gallus]XP_040524771.1 V-type proton ATPase subunit C 2 isoform X1 [Gallus gallus]XP_040524772.1 V-type proton ATPase subunit C 2 isoform X1 [Gallus gallus]XP_040524774.1 V-type proton ATPase subunit C 2 isoform X1 [Gallus gallus]XP_040524775.1 V-type proton ATPase subunit C 2 isoform X1 [Gallus gallus]XP_046770967.1 V-type proton ATPase subunit C 2 isoform X1 [Gallus gallus]|eukprot:XP_025004708.1 V-type proton ATPase subunit C 2 isoform X1 [Gallus gallus]